MATGRGMCTANSRANVDLPDPLRPSMPTTTGQCVTASTARTNVETTSLE